MARPVHWTQDPNFCHLRNPPSWYNLKPGPHYTPAPSARMEKRLAEERQAQWRWNEVQNGESIITEPCITALFCPCGVYGRTWARVRAALAGQDAENIPDPGIINADCAEFVACLPFYGCLVGRLQATVRSFYGIEGTTTADWRDGWCCPCVTLDRIEHEVIIRERQHRSLTKLHAAESDVQDQYQPESPMSYMASTKSVPGQSNGKAPPDVGANPATITCCAPTPQTTNSAAVQQAFNNNHVSGHIVHPEHALTADHMQTMESTVSAHTLEHDTTSICRTHTPTVSHGIAEDIRLQTVTPMSVRSHDITQDGVWSKRMPTPGVSHDLDQDHFVPISRPNSTHPLSNHRMVAPMGLLRPSDGVNVMSSASLRGYPKASDKRRGERAHESCRGHETRG